MKKIEAIIRSSKFEEVREALSGVGVNFLTFREVKGLGKQQGEAGFYRGAAYDMGYIARLELSIVVSDGKLQKVIDAILGSALTGEVGDGKIIVSDVSRIISIRTKEENESAF